MEFFLVPWQKLLSRMSDAASSGGTALGKSLRTEFGSADLLPTFGLINCLFAQRT